MGPGDGWVAPSPVKSAAMRGVRTTGTAPEIELRRRLYGAGLRYRVSYPVPGKPRRSIDIAFTRLRLAVFVDGCFWHGCPVHGAAPRTNSAFWAAKIAGNRARDRDTDAHLEGAGWFILRLWEHVEPEEAAGTVAAALAEIKKAVGAQGRRAQPPDIRPEVPRRGESQWSARPGPDAPGLPPEKPPRYRPRQAGPKRE